VTLKNIRLRSDMSTSALTKKIFYNTISYIIFLKDKMRPHLDIKDFYLFFITDNFYIFYQQRLHFFPWLTLPEEAFSKNGPGDYGLYPCLSQIVSVTLIIDQKIEFISNFEC